MITLLKQFCNIKKTPPRIIRGDAFIWLFTALIAAAFGILVAATVVVAILVLGIRVKFTDGELHFTEDRAGVVVIAGLAILFGQAEVASGKHKLHLALHTNDREDADGNVDVVCAYTVDKAAIEARADKLGNRVDAHTTMSVGLATLDNLTIEADRRSNLDNYRGKSGLAVTAELVLIEAEGVRFGVGREHRHVLFATEENNFLIEGAKTLYLLNSAAAYAGFESYAEIVTHGYLIKAFVEGDGLDVNAGVDNLNALTSYRARSVDYLLSHIAEVHTNILKTILIARRIENLIYADAAKLFFAVAAKPAEQAVFFIHYNSSLFG